MRYIYTLCCHELNQLGDITGNEEDIDTFSNKKDALKALRSKKYQDTDREEYTINVYERGPDGWCGDFVDCLY
jgi:hypothetical protein